MTTTAAPRTANGIKTFRSLTLHVDGAVTLNVWTPTGEDDLLRRLQQTVGGYVEVVRLTPAVHLWLNEDGAYRLPMNPYASALGQCYGLGSYDYYFGPAVVTGGTDLNGGSLELGVGELTGLITVLTGLGADLTELSALLAGVS